MKAILWGSMPCDLVSICAGNYLPAIVFSHVFRRKIRRTDFANPEKRRSQVLALSIRFARAESERILYKIDYKASTGRQRPRGLA
jgi:hypothetical protein